MEEIRMETFRALEELKIQKRNFATSFDFSEKKARKSLKTSDVFRFKRYLSKLFDALVELEFITIDETNNVVQELLKKTKKMEAKIRKIAKDEDAINDDIKELALSISEEIDAYIPVIEHDFQTKDIINKKTPITVDIVKKIAQSFVSKRKGKEEGITILDHNLQPDWNEGTFLSLFQDFMDAKHVFTFGTGKDVEVCQRAKENGVGEVAKGGIERMSRGTMDIGLYFTDYFTYHGTDNSTFGMGEVYDFRRIVRNSRVKNGGFLLFNLPYFKIPHFENAINTHLKVEGVYRTDDELGNMIFVTTLRQGDNISQRKLLKKAFRVPNKIPHYSEMETFYINKGELILPEIFDGLILDERDYKEAFRNEISAFDQIQNKFKPKQLIMELSNPLQEYRLGHLGGVAASGVANGIYDTSLFPELVEEGFEHPHLLTFKILKKDVKTKSVEVVAGEEVEVESWQKTHTIVMSALYPDGTIKEFLNTEKVNDEEEEEASLVRA